MSTIESVSRESRIFEPQPAFAAKARIKSRAEYDAMYARSLSEPDAFWLELAKELHWFREPTKGLDYSNAPHATWFGGSSSVKRQRRTRCKPAFSLR